jgi:hypothetical protein
MVQSSQSTSDEEVDLEQELRNLGEIQKILNTLHWFLGQVFPKLAHRVITQPENEFAWRDVQAAIHLSRLGLQSLATIPLQLPENRRKVADATAGLIEELDGLTNLVENVHKKITN